jgi:hypothetical protein
MKPLRHPLTQSQLAELDDIGILEFANEQLHEGPPSFGLDQWRGYLEYLHRRRMAQAARKPGPEAA